MPAMGEVPGTVSRNVQHVHQADATPRETEHLTSEKRRLGGKTKVVAPPTAAANQPPKREMIPAKKNRKVQHTYCKPDVGWLMHRASYASAMHSHTYCVWPQNVFE